MNESQIMERALGLGCPMVVAGGGAISGEHAWRAAAAIPGLRDTLDQQLTELEAKVAADAARDARWAADDARRAEVGACDPAAGEAFRAETTAELIRYEAERPARVEDLLKRILDALEKKTVAAIGGR